MELNYSEKIAKRLDVPVGVLSDVPRIELWGATGLTVEGHKGLLRYERDCIIVAAKGMIIEVRGFDLELDAMSRGDLSIKGEILSINLGKGEQDDQEGN